MCCCTIPKKISTWEGALRMGRIPTTAHLQASTTDDSLKRQGSGANFVAIAGDVPVCRMKPPMNSSEKPNP
jgi:hypothetical protein